jgi:hypothetical protein
MKRRTFFKAATPPGAVYPAFHEPGKAWTFTCCLCGTFTTIYSDIGCDVSKAAAETKVRQAGEWSKTGVYGWVHKRCLAKRHKV